MKVIGTSNFEYDDGEMSEVILDIEERHIVRNKEKNDTEFIDGILDIMLESYISKFDAKRIQMRAHFKVMMMHFKEDVKYAKDKKDVEKAIEKYNRHLKRKIKVTDNDLMWTSLMSDVDEIVKEFSETKTMINKLYDMVMDKKYYFKAKILENRNNVCNDMEVEFSNLLNTENGKKFKKEIEKAYEMCNDEFLNDERFNEIK